MNFFGGATSLDSFVNAYKTKETRGFFPKDGLVETIIITKKNSSYDSFFSILRNSNNHLEKIISISKTFLNVVYLKSKQ